MFGKNLEKERKPERSWRRIEGISSELKEKGEQYESAIRSALEGMGILPEEIKTIEQRRFDAVLENAIETAIERDRTGHGRSFDEFIEDNPPHVPARTFREEIMRVREKKALDIGLAEASAEWLRAREAYKRLLRAQDLSPLDLKDAGERAREDLKKLGIQEGDPEWERKYGLKIREYTLGKLSEKDVESEVNERFGISYVGRAATRILSNTKSPEYQLSRSLGRVVYTDDIIDDARQPSDFDKESKQSQEWREEKNIRLSYNNETNTFFIDSPIIERAKTLITEITETKFQELASEPDRFLGKIKHMFDTAQEKADAYIRKLRTIASQRRAAGVSEEKILEYVKITRTEEEDVVFKQLYTSAKILVGYLESYKRSVRSEDQNASMSSVSSMPDDFRNNSNTSEKPINSPSVPVAAEDSTKTGSDSKVSQFDPNKTQEWEGPIPSLSEVIAQDNEKAKKIDAESSQVKSSIELPPPPPSSRVEVRTVDSSPQTGSVNGTVESMPKGVEKGPASGGGLENSEKTERIEPNKYFTRKELDAEHPKIPEAVEQLLKKHGAVGVSTAVDKWFSDLPSTDRADIKGMLNHELQDLDEQNLKAKSVLVAELLRRVAHGEEVEFSALENQDISELESQFKNEVAEVEGMLSVLGPQLGFGKNYNEIVQAISNDERFKSVPLAAFDHKKKSLETFFNNDAGKVIMNESVVARWREQCKEFSDIVQTIRETLDVALPDTDKRIGVPTPADVTASQGGESAPVAPGTSAPEAPEVPPATVSDANIAAQAGGTPLPPPPVTSGGGSGVLPPNGPGSAEVADGSLDRFSFHDVEVIDRELRDALAKIDRSALDLFSVSDGSERITIDTLRNAINLLLDAREMEDGDPKNLTVTERYGSLTYKKEDIEHAQKIVAFAAPSFFNFLHEEREKYAKQYGGEEGLEAMEGYRPDPEVLIPEAQNFDELYEVLRNIGSINGPRKLLLADEIIDIVKHVRAGEYTLDAVPIAYGLREKVDALTKDEAIRIVEAGRRTEEARVAAAATTPVISEPTPVSPEPIPTPPGGAGEVSPTSGEQPSPEGADVGTATGSEVAFKHYVSNSERVAERQRIKASPEYQKARTEWLEKRQASAEQEQKYQAALADFYKDLEGGEYGRIKRFGYEVGKIFGLKPSLSPELQKLKDEAGAAHDAYQQNGIELARIRKNLETDAYNQKVMAEYGRLLSQKILFDSLSGRTKIQREALEKIYPPAKKTLEWLATHPKTTFALGAGAFTLIGASGGALAGVAALGGYTASAGAGLVSGEATRRLLNKYYVSRKKEQLSTSRERAQTKFLDRKVSEYNALIEFREEAVDSAQRTTTATSVGAAFAGGMAAGALYNAVTTPGVGAEAVKPSESTKTAFDSAGFNESFDPPVSSSEAAQPSVTTQPPAVESRSPNTAAPTPERPTFLTSNGTPYATPELNVQLPPETVTTPSSPDVSVEIMPDAEQVNAVSKTSESVVPEQQAAAVTESQILDDIDPQLNQTPEVIQVSATQPSVPEGVDFAAQGGEVSPSTPNTEGYTSVGSEVIEGGAETASVAAETMAPEQGAQPAAVESAQKAVIGNSAGVFENDPSFSVGDGRWGTTSTETTPQVMDLDYPGGPAELGSRALESAPQKTVNMAEVGALGLAGLTVLGMQKRKSIWDSILSKGKFGGLIGLIFGGRKKKEVPPVKK